MWVDTEVEARGIVMSEQGGQRADVLDPPIASPRAEVPGDLPVALEAIRECLSAAAAASGHVTG